MADIVVCWSPNPKDPDDPEQFEASHESRNGVKHLARASTPSAALDRLGAELSSYFAKAVAEQKRREQRTLESAIAAGERERELAIEERERQVARLEGEIEEARKGLRGLVQARGSK